MKKQQAFALFVCTLVPWTVGHGLLSLWAVYAKQLGANPSMTGNFLAVAYFTLAFGTIAGGWLSARWQRRK